MRLFPQKRFPCPLFSCLAVVALLSHPQRGVWQVLQKGDVVKVMRKNKIEFRGEVERFRQTGHRSEGYLLAL